MNVQASSDRVLLGRYLSGDRSAISQLIERHSRRVRDYIRMLVKDRDVAEDIFQETFIKAVRVIDEGRYADNGKFLSWILRIAHNQVIDHFRARRQNKTLTEAEAGFDVLGTLRLAMGGRDMENGTVELVRRDTLEKETLPQEGLVDHIEGLMTAIQENIFKKALDYRNSMITRVDTWDEFKRVLDEKGGFISAHWDGTVETEVAIKEATKATIRCIPVDAEDEEGVCVFSGKPSHRRVLFARSY